MVIRPRRESARGWTLGPRGGASQQSSPLNEHDWALNVFWLPGDREEGVRGATAKAGAPQVRLAPGRTVTRWHQMGD